MQCRYCRAWNEEDERRCVRCGRRLAVMARPSTDQFPLSTSTAPSLELLSHTASASASASAAPAYSPAPETGPAETQYQPAFSQPGPSQSSLFRDVSNTPKVIPIPTLAPLRVRENSELAREWAKEERRREESARRKRHPRPPQKPDSQTSLDFYGVSAPLGSPTPAVIYCDAPVATPTHRLIAAAIDSAFLLA